MQLSLQQISKAPHMARWIKCEPFIKLWSSSSFLLLIIIVDLHDFMVHRWWSVVLIPCRALLWHQILVVNLAIGLISTTVASILLALIYGTVLLTFSMALLPALRWLDLPALRVVDGDGDTVWLLPWCWPGWIWDVGNRRGICIFFVVLKNFFALLVIDNLGKETRFLLVLFCIDHHALLCAVLIVLWLEVIWRLFLKVSSQEHRLLLLDLFLANEHSR